MENNKKRNNNLFALEQGLFGNKTSQQQSQQPSPKKRKRRREEARAFDFGEAIELRYNGEAFPTATPEARSFSAPNSFASELEDESLPFEVEAFEVDKDVTPVSKPVTPKPETPVKPEIAEDVTSKQMEVQPVKATVVPPSDIPLKSARPVKQPSRVEETPSKEELSDAEAFAADLQAILNGEKTYDSEQQQVVPTSPTAPPPAPTSHPHDIFDKGQGATPNPPQKPVEPKPVPMSRSHAVFDQMGKNMAHATNFDQGTVDLALEQAFDEFDRILDEEEKNNQSLSKAKANNKSGISRSQSGLQSVSLSHKQPNQIASALVSEHNIQTIVSEKKEENIEENPSTDIPYDRAFIGSGSSIAYYINALGDDLDRKYLGKEDFGDERYKDLNNILIGEQDPWQPNYEKSRGSGYINHQLQLIAQWGDEVPEYSFKYLDRLTFSEQNRKVINRVKNQVPSAVKKISRVQDGTFFIQAEKEDYQYTARKVIVGMGAGPNKTVEDVSDTIDIINNLSDENKNRIIDIDRFMRIDLKPEEEGKNKLTIIVHGPNAGIDPVERAASLGHEVIWFIRNTLPVFLDGQLLEYAPSVEPIKVTHVSVDNGENEKPLKVSYEIKAEQQRDEKQDFSEIEADYYVLALGQNINAEGAAGKVIDSKILNKLEPIYDINQIYSDKPYETVLGLQAQGTTKEEGLEIIGAAAYSLGNQVEHNYIKKAKKTLEEYLDGIVKLESDDKNYEPTNNILRDFIVALYNNIISPYYNELLDKPHNAVLIAKSFKKELKKYFELHPSSFSDTQKQILEHLFNTVMSILQDIAEATAYFAQTAIEEVRGEWKKRKGVRLEIMNQVKHEAANVIVSPQLATVRASVGAIHSVMPNYAAIRNEELHDAIINENLRDDYKNVIEEDYKEAIKKLGVNFSADNRTVIRVYMAQKYPNIQQEEDAQYIIDAIIKHRRTGYHPLGYNKFWIEHWEKSLNWWSDNNNNALSRDEKDNYRKLEESTRKLMEALEEKCRHEWRSINKNIQRYLDDSSLTNYLQDLKTTKKYLFDMLIQAYTQQQDIVELAFQIVNNVNEDEIVKVEIVLEGVLAPRQKDIVFNQILALPV